MDSSRRRQQLNAGLVGRNARASNGGRGTRSNNNNNNNSNNRYNRRRDHLDSAAGGGGVQATTCFTTFSTEGQEFYELCSSYTNLSTLECILCYRDFENDSNVDALTCSKGHTLCSRCSNQWLVSMTSGKEVDSIALTKRKGLVYCPLHRLNMVSGATAEQFCCQSKPYSIEQVRSALPYDGDIADMLEGSLERYKELHKFEQRMKLLVSRPKKQVAKIEKFLLAETLSKTLKDPRMCRMCNFGPVEPRDCADTGQHHGQIVGYTSDGQPIKINNSCPRCGWFSRNREDWPFWNQKVDFRDTQNPIFVVDALLRRFHWRNTLNNLNDLGYFLLPQNVRNRWDFKFSNLTELGKASILIGGILLSLVLVQAIGINLTGFYSGFTAAIDRILDFITTDKCAVFVLSTMVLLDFLIVSWELSVNQYSIPQRPFGKGFGYFSVIYTCTVLLKPYFDILKWLSIFHYYGSIAFRLPLEVFASIVSFIAINPIKFLLKAAIKFTLRQSLMALLLGFLFLSLLWVERKNSAQEYEDYLKFAKELEKIGETSVDDEGDNEKESKTAAAKAAIPLRPNGQEVGIAL